MFTKNIKKNCLLLLLIHPFIMTTPCWSYKSIRKNIYSEHVPRSDLFDVRCSCTDGPAKCSTEECINRATFVECSETCGASCMNRRIQKNDWAPKIERILTNDKGYGIFATAQIKKGDFILEYVGEVLTENKFEERMHTIYKNETHHYCLQLRGQLVIDGQRVGWEGRFVNHSCEPNCEMQQWLVDGLPRMALFALRDIQKGEELSYDYNFVLFDSSKGQVCCCGSNNCRGVIGVPKKDYNKQRLPVAKSREWIDSDDVLSTRTTKQRNGGFYLADLPTNTKVFVHKKKCFLLKNYEKIAKRRREVQDNVVIQNKLDKIMAAWSARYRTGLPLKKAQDTSESGYKLSAISQIICELFVNLSSAEDEIGTVLCQPFVSFEFHRNRHQRHRSFESVLDFYQMGRKIINGQYQSLSNFDADLDTVLTSFTAAFSEDNPGIIENARKMKRLYATLKKKAAGQIKFFSLNQGNRDSAVQDELPNFKNIPVNPVVDTVIRCICGRFFEEDLMVQCEKCRVWQHSDCMRVAHDRKNEQRIEQNVKKQRVKPSASVPAQGTSNEASYLSIREDQVLLDGIVVSVLEHLPMLDMVDGSDITDKSIDDMEGYLVDKTNNQQVLKRKSETVSGEDERVCQSYYCDQCEPRPVIKDVLMKNGDDSDPNKIEFKTLVREDGFMVSKNDTVYVLKEGWRVNSVSGTDIPTYLTAGPLVLKKCDILHVDSLYIHSNGNKYVYGRLYVRPNDTFHESNRGFFRNEICLSPVNKLVPINLIHGRCWVLDPSTYCTGRPIGCEEEHVYICEYKVDRWNGGFSKIDEFNHAVCMKPYAFKFFERKIRIDRNFSVTPLCST